MNLTVVHSSQFQSLAEVKYDLTIGAAFECEPWAQFIFFVDDRDGIMFVRLVVSVDDHSYLTFFVFDDQIDPLSQPHA